MATPSPPDPGAPEPNHYALLRLPESATPQQLRAAFRTLSKLYHPDTTPLPLAEASLSFQRLQQAYAVLIDPSARRAYDIRRTQARSSGQAAADSPSQAGDAAFRAGFSSTGFPMGHRPPGASGSAGAADLRASGRSTSVRRALSGGEWFALLLLAVALLLSLVLGVGLAWARGAELMRQPSWWGDQIAHPGTNNAGIERVPVAPISPPPPSQ